MAIPAAAAAVLKKVAASIGKAVAQQAASRPGDTFRSLYKIVIAGVAVPVILLVAVLTSIPMALADNTSQSEIASQIEAFIGAQDEIETYARAVAEARAAQEVQKIKEQESERTQSESGNDGPITRYEPIGVDTPDGPGVPSPTPSPTPTPTPTPQPTPTPIPIVVDKDYQITTPSWRVLMALSAAYSGQSPSEADIPAIVTFVKSNLHVNVEVETEKSEERINITAYVEVYTDSITELAKLLESKNVDITADEKAGIAQNCLGFLSYYDESGTYLQTPYNDSTGGSNPAQKLTPEQIQEIIDKLPPGLTADREAAVLAAYSLVGKVEYFWGGKSRAIGWDDRWGSMKKVTSPNNPSTGTMRPFGLDCSGFVGWVLIQATQDPKVLDIVGSGSAVQWNKSVPLDWSDALPGDIAFKCPPGKPNHVGIVVGRDSNGEILVIHSPQTGKRVALAKLSRTSFRFVRRPAIFLAQSQNGQ